VSGAVEAAGRAEPLAAGGETLATILAGRAAATPDAVAYLALDRGEEEAGALRFAELEARVRAVAAELRRRCEPGDRVLLLFPTGPEFVVGFYACAYAGVVAVAVQPPEGWRLRVATARMEAIRADSGAAAVLATGAMREELRRTLADSPAWSLPWVLTDEAGDAPPGDGPLADPAPGDPALVQYTSGSTGTPKGVVLTHANLAAQGVLLEESTAAEEGATSVSWPPLHHDMGIVSAVVLPVRAGMRCVMMSPLAFLQRPARWLQAISRYGAVFSGGPTFAYDQCARRVTYDERAGLDLSSWGTAFIGAEPLRADVIDRFCKAFAPAGFAREALWASWGLAESTCVVTGSPPPERFSIRHVDRDRLAAGEAVDAEPGAAGALPKVGSGRPVGGHETLVVDPERREALPDGRVGELWVRGPSVGLGYWGREDATAETFGGRLADGTGPFLRTGDLGFARGGEVFVTGRMKELIVMRGRTIAPEDVELAAGQAHPAAEGGAGAAFPEDRDGEERLVVVQEVEAGAREAAGEALEAIRRAVRTEIGVSPARVVLVGPRSIPRTPSGKVRRGACRDALRDGGLKTVGEGEWT
jgi:acyl-CoA synthetase (AMP-forming)/AMP-acid ligase II